MNEAQGAARAGSWDSLPEPFRQLKYADLVRRLAPTLGRDQLVQALALTSSFCSMAARWAETQPSTTLASYRTALLVADPHASWCRLPHDSDRRFPKSAEAFSPSAA